MDATSSWPRVIAHVDADAFFAAIEIRDRPELAGKPVVVGGSPRSRGVVATCDYVAREYGIRSGMPLAEAYRRCPHAVFLPVARDKYAAASRQMRALFAELTDRVEPLSLDEAFLDLTGVPGDPVEACLELKRRIRETIGVTVSIGLSYNKLLAKLASDMDKPDGFTAVDPRRAQEVLRDLPLERLWGVGPKTAARLRRFGWRTAGDLAAAGPQALVRAVGAWGHALHLMACGVDHRPVTPPGTPKSVSREETFEADISGREACLAELAALAEEVALDLRHEGARGRTVTLKVKYADFRVVTRSETLAEPVRTSSDVYAAAARLLDRVNVRRPIRLLGIGVSNLVWPGRFVQVSLFAPDDERPQAPPGTQVSRPVAPETAEALDAAMDAVRRRFGPAALRRARALMGRRKR